MDWDWEDAPPQDVPRRRPEEPPQSPASDTTFSGAVEHFERPLPPAPREDVLPPEFDDERTQIIRRPDEAPAPAPDSTSFAEAVQRFEPPVPEPQAPRSDLDRAPSEGIEIPPPSARPEAGGARYDERRRRTPEARAAARARRRRQIRRRRLTALAVLVVIVVLLVVLVVRGCGGPAEGQAATLGFQTPVALRTQTAAEPLRVAAYGESVAGAILVAVAEDWHLPAFKEGQ